MQNTSYGEWFSTSVTMKYNLEHKGVHVPSNVWLNQKIGQTHIVLL